jgi:hypothetical protein
LIVANVAVWLFYELPNLNSAVFHASTQPAGTDFALGLEASVPEGSRDTASGQ